MEKPGQGEELEQAAETTEQQTPVVETVSAETEKAKDKVEAAAPVAPEYTPDYKFKSYDKELEFDDWLKAAIKSKEHEEKLRDIYTKAHGLDDMKPKYNSLQEKYGKINEQYTTITGSINKLEKHLQSGDIGTFFEGLGYNKETANQMIAKYMLEQIKLQEMPEDQRKILLDAQAATKKSMTYEEQNQLLQQQLEEVKTNQFKTEIDLTLNHPEFADVVKFYDSKLGKPGAFEDRMIKRGKEIYFGESRTATPKEVASEIAAEIKVFMDQQQVAANPMQQQFQAKPKPTIPQMQGNSTSPAQKGFSSFEDIDKYVQERWGQ